MFACPRPLGIIRFRPSACQEVHPVALQDTLHIGRFADPEKFQRAREILVWEHRFRFEVRAPVAEHAVLVGEALGHCRQNCEFDFVVHGLSPGLLNRDRPPLFICSAECAGTRWIIRADVWVRLLRFGSSAISSEGAMHLSPEQKEGLVAPQ